MCISAGFRKSTEDSSSVKNLFGSPTPRTHCRLATIALSNLPRNSARESGRMDQLLLSHVIPAKRKPASSRQRRSRRNRITNHAGPYHAPCCSATCEQALRVVLAGSGFGRNGERRGLDGLCGRCLGSEGDGGVGFKLPVVLKFHFVADFLGLEEHRYGGLDGQQIFLVADGDFVVVDGGGNFARQQLGRNLGSGVTDAPDGAGCGVGIDGAAVRDDGLRQIAETEAKRRVLFVDREIENGEMFAAESFPTVPGEPGLAVGPQDAAEQDAEFAFGAEGRAPAALSRVDGLI